MQVTVLELMTKACNWHYNLRLLCVCSSGWGAGEGGLQKKKKNKTWKEKYNFLTFQLLSNQNANVNSFHHHNLIQSDSSDSTEDQYTCIILLQKEINFWFPWHSLCKKTYRLTIINYSNDPKFSDRYAWTNSADPDQTAPRGAVWSGSTLFAIASFGLIMVAPHSSNFRVITTIFWGVRIFRKFTGVLTIALSPLCLQKASQG